MASHRSLLRSLHPERWKPHTTCPHCGSTAYIRKNGTLQKHRQPGMNLGYGMPTYAGPTCPQSGKPHVPRR